MRCPGTGAERCPCKRRESWSRANKSSSELGHERRCLCRFRGAQQNDTSDRPDRRSGRDCRFDLVSRFFESRLDYRSDVLNRRRPGSNLRQVIAEFGGGFIIPLNQLSGNPDPRPECTTGEVLSETMLKPQSEL